MKNKIENLRSRSTWPWWFPYPSSWLRALLLAPIAFPFNILILFGIVGLIASVIQFNFLIFTLALITGIVLPTLIFAFFYHLGWYKWQNNENTASESGWLPQGESLRQGFFAMLIMTFSFLIVLTLFLSLIYLGCQLSASEASDVLECSSRTLGRVAGAISRQMTHVWEIDRDGVLIRERETYNVRPWFWIWLAIAAYLYQIEYFAQRVGFPWIRKKMQASSQAQSRNRRSATPVREIDPVDRELARLRGDMGLTSIQKNQTSGKFRQPAPRLHRFRWKHFKWIALSLAATAIALFLGLHYLPPLQPPTTDVSNIAPPSPQSDSFADAVRTATAAAQLAQSAQTPAEWELVAEQWQQAATLMRSVPADLAQFELARQKAIEYEKNLQYAQTNAKKSP